MHKKEIIIACLILVFAAVVFAFSIVELNHLREEKVGILALQSQKEQNDKEKLVILQEIALLSPTENNFLNAGVQADKINYNKISEFYFKKVHTDVGLYRLANIYFKDKKYKEAEKTLLKIHNQNNTSLQLMADTYLYMGEFEKAQKNCDRLEEENKLKDNCALVYLVRGKDEKIKPKNMSVTISQIAAVSNSQSRALKIYFYLNAHVNPQSAWIYLKGQGEKLKTSRDGNIVFGNEHFNNNDYIKAAEYLEVARKIDPYYPQVYEHLIEVYRKLGNSKLEEEYSKTLKNLIWH